MATILPCAAHSRASATPLSRRCDMQVFQASLTRQTCIHSASAVTQVLCGHALRAGRASRMLAQCAPISLEIVVMGYPFIERDWRRTPALQKDAVRALLTLSRWCLWIASL